MVSSSSSLGLIVRLKGLATSGLGTSPPKGHDWQMRNHSNKHRVIRELKKLYPGVQKQKQD